MENQWKHKILEANEADFESIALDLFRFQYRSNPVYRDYVDALHVNADKVHDIAGIPFLPIRFFKSHEVKATVFEPALTFESSGTTGMSSSRHLVKDPGVYKESFTRAFHRFYGDPGDWCIIGLLPSYLERGQSSLVYMVNELISQSGQPESGFYLNEYGQLHSLLAGLEKEGRKALLIGVTFALLDFAAQYPFPLHHSIVMETGGMKGRRKEMIRQEVHDVLKAAFSLPAIHSEYGMTELLSQAYSRGDGIFHCPPWMRIVLRDDEDPLSPAAKHSGRQTGAINVIDLANIFSCSFIATDDAGRLYDDGSFEVLGRIDNSDIRGCSLMVL